MIPPLRCLPDSADAATRKRHASGGSAYTGVARRPQRNATHDTTLPPVSDIGAVEGIAGSERTP